MNSLLSKVVVVVLLLLIAAVAATTSTTAAAIRGGTSASASASSSSLPTQEEKTNDQNENQNHRVLIAGTTVELYMIDIEYEPSSEHPHGYSEDIWEFKLDKDDAIIFGTEWIEMHNAEQFINNDNNIEPGWFMTIHENIILIDNKFHLPNEAEVTFSITHPNDSVNSANSSSDEDDESDDDDDDDSQGTQGRRARGMNGSYSNRKLADKTGTLTTLVVRVIDSNGIGAQRTDSSTGSVTKIDIAKLKDDVYNDDVSLKTQYDACSYGKLKIQPYSGTTRTGKVVNGGVTEITLSNTVAKGNDRGTVQQAAFNAATEQIGDFVNDFDLIMFCMPPGTSANSDGSGNWLAYAFVGKTISFYNNQWCSSVSAQLHEVGHNLGLSHSGQETNKYADQSGMMGFSYDKDDTKMCFNAAKNWQLTWYNNQDKSINPLSTNDLGSTGIKRFTINGIEDYKKNTNAIINLQLKQPNRSISGLNPLDPSQSNGVDYYIGYNRASDNSINSQTVEDANYINIIKKIGDPLSGGQSWKVAALALGQSYVINDYNGEFDKDVEIRYVGLTNSASNFGRDATIEIINLSIAKGDGVDDDKFLPGGTDGPPCRLYNVIVVTDGYPTDTAWSIVEMDGIGEFVGANDELVAGNTEYIETICLPYDKCYMYTISDKYGDGICCGQGQGGYKVSAQNEQNGNLVAGGGKFVGEFITNAKPGDSNDLKQSKQEKFCTGEDPNPSAYVPIVAVPDKVVCKDLPGTKKLFKWKKTSNKRISCKRIKKKNKCRNKKKFRSTYVGKHKDKQYQSMRFHEICPLSCGTCPGDE